MGGTGSGEGSSTGAPVGPGVFERGFVLPANSLPCVPVDTGVPQDECNHHGSTVDQLADGTIAVVWYHGEFEKSLDSRVVWAKHVGDGQWSQPEVLFDDPDRSEGNPAIWVSPTGEILVFFVSIWGEGWDDTRIRLVRSDDDGATWSDPVMLRDDDCWNTRQKPILLENGDLVLPLYLECLAVPMYMYSSDEFVSDVRWTEFDALPDPATYLGNHLGQIQPSLAIRDDGTISALTRNGTGTGEIRRAIADATATDWSASVGIDLPNSGTSIDQVKLANGHVVVIFNNSPDVRFPLAAALSTDDGETFTAVRHLVDECEGQDCEFHYPSVVQADDETIWVSYTHDRETIGWVHFDETWLAQGDETANLP